MATYCPYCDEEIEEAILNEWVGDYWLYYNEFICPKCGKEMEIDVESEPIFITHRKENK